MAGDTKWHRTRDEVLADTRARLVAAFGAASSPVAVGRAVYAWWLRRWYGRRGVHWRVNGEPIRIDPDVRFLIPRVSEPALFRQLRGGIRPGDTVLDVGSFLGTYAIFEARWAGPGGRVAAFEPTAASRAMLQRHVALNGVGERVTVVGAAVSDRAATGELLEYDEPYTNRVRTADDRTAPTSAVPVEIVTLDDTCARLGLVPNWIRMDVQGAEFHVLRGARGIIRAGRGRLNIVVEMHPEQWPLFGMDLSKGKAVLSDLGLEAEPLEAGLDCFGQGDHALLRYV